MSNKTQESKDVFSVCKKNVDKFFQEIEKTTPQYQQSIANLQQDYIEAWKHVLNSAIALEKEYAAKTGMHVNVPDATLQTVRDITEQAMKAYTSQNKMVQDTTEVTKQAFNTFNQNTKSLASLNRNIMGFMMSVFEQKSNA